MKMHKISKMKRAVGSAAVCGSVMVLGSVAMLAGSQQATAQQLEEIVVTSERRETKSARYAYFCYFLQL